MDLRSSITVVANFVVIAGLISLGFSFFADYHAAGRWAKNVTGLLAGIGMLALAASMLLTPANAAVIVRMAQTGASRVFLVISSGLLLAALAAFGIINFSPPFPLFPSPPLSTDPPRTLPPTP